MRTKLSKRLVECGYDKDFVKKLFKDMSRIIVADFADGVESVMIDDIVGINLIKYDPRGKSYLDGYKFYVTYMPKSNFHIKLIRELRYASQYLLTDEEKEFNRTVEEEIRLQKAGNGTSEED